MATNDNQDLITTQSPAGASSKRIQADDRLDALFMREMRCPYCQTRMPKGTSKCANCALTKEQIYYAKLTHPYKPGRHVLQSKVRPAELPYWKMTVASVFGLFGVHCFITKRYVRGAVILFLTVAFLVSLFLFPPAFGEFTAHETRIMFEEKTFLFPGDLLGIFALGMWVWDLFAIHLRQFKYPVVPELKEEQPQ